jgi:glyoxylase-like metal-dependent hydrolase (beta-lactamase superfamily II)
MLDQTLEQVADGIYKVCLPLPFALRIVNCYLLRDGAGWAVVDCGINTDEGRATWHSVFQELGIRPRDLTKIILTHVHPDHFGLAGYLQVLAQEDGHSVSVYTSPREDRQARLIWHAQSDVMFKDWLVANGMPIDMATVVDAGMGNTRAMTLPHPPRLEAIHDGETLQIGERTFRLIGAEGHSDGQLMLFCEQDGVMLSGDHVLMKITPNIGLWTETDPHPLQRYLANLHAVKTLPVRVALPGHKWLITDWRGRVEELIAHHHERLDKTLEAVHDGRTNPYDVSLFIFESMRFSPHEWRFALAEALAHLDYLVQDGRLHYHADTHTFAYR